MPDKIHFRKSKTGRQVWRIDGKMVTTIINMHSRVMIDHQDNSSYGELIVEDSADYLPSTEAEFFAAHKDALAICTLLKIV